MIPRFLGADTIYRDGEEQRLSGGRERGRNNHDIYSGCVPLDGTIRHPGIR